MARVKAKTVVVRHPVKKNNEQQYIEIAERIATIVRRNVNATLQHGGFVTLNFARNLVDSMIAQYKAEDKAREGMYDKVRPVALKALDLE